MDVWERQRTLARTAAWGAASIRAGLILAARPDPRVAGAGSAIIVQGVFLLLRDGYHALRLRG